MTRETHARSAPTVLLAGATGLVGREALALLAADADMGAVRALVRRPVTLDDLLGPRHAEAPMHSQRLQIVVADFERLADHEAACFAGVDWVVCALGTTLALAGSQAAFRRVDFDYPLAIARLAKRQGARRFALVSALGASARSRVFYSRVKGELEEAIGVVGFEQVVVAQPSLLAGERPAFRLAEEVGKRLGFLMPAAYKPVHPRQVAAGLLSGLKAERPGWHVLSNAALRRMR